MKRNNERGIAIVLSLFLMSAMSVLAASLMFLAQTETYASMNYRMMSQARYAGEAGVQKASDFLLDSAQYNVPISGGAFDPLRQFTTRHRVARDLHGRAGDSVDAMWWRTRPTTPWQPFRQPLWRLRRAPDGGHYHAQLRRVRDAHRDADVPGLRRHAERGADLGDHRRRRTRRTGAPQRHRGSGGRCRNAESRRPTITPPLRRPPPVVR